MMARMLTSSINPFWTRSDMAALFGMLAGIGLMYVSPVAAIATMGFFLVAQILIELE